MTYRPSLDNAHLLTWNEVRSANVPWPNLLLGNGASIAVAESFAYPSLYQVASSGDLDHPVSDEAQLVFDDFNTTNFEYVLASLKVTGRVCSAVGIDAPQLPELYASIQRSLFEAVAHVHIGWQSVSLRTLPRLRRDLTQYHNVFSTNYDLLVYWAVLREGNPDDFKDFFWNPGNTFDLTNVDVSGNPTLVYYLHGGLHLRRTSEGGSFKQTAQQQNLLDRFPTSWESDETPLLISEGTAADKVTSINRSDYLSFAYRRFVESGKNLVIFGHSLGESDDHVVRAINSWSTPQSARQIAISVRPDEPNVQGRKQWLAQRLPNADVWFYDADTSPLGQPQVRPHRFRDLNLWRPRR